MTTEQESEPSRPVGCSGLSTFAGHISGWLKRSRAPSVFNGVEAALGLPQESIFLTPLLTSETFSMDNTSWSIFGTVDFEPVDGLVFTAGFNYTDDKKDFALSQTSFDPLGQVNLVDAFIVGGIAQALMVAPGSVDAATIAGFASNPATAPIFQAITAAALDPAQNPLLALQAFQFQPPFLAIPNAVEDGKTRDDKLTYLFRASYEVTPEVNVYASYATGFKASSVNLSRDSRPLNTDFTAGLYLLQRQPPAPTASVVSLGHPLGHDPLYSDRLLCLQYLETIGAESGLGGNGERNGPRNRHATQLLIGLD